MVPSQQIKAIVKDKCIPLMQHTSEFQVKCQLLLKEWIFLLNNQQAGAIGLSDLQILSNIFQAFGICLAQIVTLSCESMLFLIAQV